MAFCCTNTCIKQKQNKLDENQIKNELINSKPNNPNNEPFAEPTMIIKYEAEHNNEITINKEKQLVKFMNSTNEILEQIRSYDLMNDEIQLINVPRIVVVGTQSSGKSTLINRFIGYDILPVGDNMVTRTPVNIRLNSVNTADECISTISIYNDGVKKIIHSVRTEVINNNEFKTKIIDATDILTKHRYRISNNQIFIDINAINIENMTIIDLPGIISISCTDIGQPENIVEEIKNLINEQLKYPQTYILAVISALVDLETDSGLAAIKKMQEKDPNLKAVGVLTKVDMLKSVKKINNIINNTANVSQNIMLNDGYYVVNNLISDESPWYINTLQDTAIIQKKKYGIYNIKSHLKKVLIAMIKEKLPKIKINLVNTLKNIIQITPKLENNLDHPIAKIQFINNMLYILSRGITDSFNAIGIWKNVGNDIKKTFDDFFTNTTALNPFSQIEFSDSNLQEVIENFIGYVPNANDITFLVVNRCLTDENKQPVKLMMPFVDKCINALIKITTDNMNEMLRLKKLDIYPLNLNKYNISLNSFPKLRDYIMNSCVNLIEKYRNITFENIHHLLSIHERHLIWHDQDDFDNYYANYQTINTISTGKTMEQIINTNEENNEVIKIKYDQKTQPQNPALLRMRTLLKTCFDKIVKTCQDEIYKTIISDIIKEFEHHFFIEITETFISMTENKLNELFYDTDDIIKNKKVCDNITKSIEELIAQTDNLLQ